MDQLDIETISLGAITYFFEKAFEPLKNSASYQLDKITFNKMCSEAHNHLFNLDQVRTINEFDKSVSLFSFYVPPKVTSLDLDATSDNKTFIVESIDDFSSNKKILISGIVGQGKSILMRKLAIQEAYKCKKFPIFLELKDMDDNENLEKFMKRNIKSIIKIENEKAIISLLKDGKIVFFFDGFDEIKTNHMMKKVVKEFESIERKFPNLKFIVSSRPEDTIDKSTIFSKFLIKKLDLENQIKVIEKLTEEPLIKINLINNLKEADKDIQGVLVTPLMVNFYFYLYKTEQITGNNITLFYNKLFDLTLRKHDGTKLLYNRTYVTGLTPEGIESAFECTCFLSCKQGTFFFAEYTFLEIVEKTIKFQKLKCSAHDLIKDFTTGICFIGREGQSYAFLHTSIPEFFAAKFILNNMHNTKGLLKEIIDNYINYIDVVDYIEKINKKEFYLNFLQPVLNESINFFASKEILDNIYISTKYYDKKRKDNNVISVIAICDSSVHRYIASDFKKFIKPFVIEHISKKYTRRKKTTYNVYWRKSSSSSNEKEIDVIQSENYFLHERIDNDGIEIQNPSTVSTTIKDLYQKIKEEDFNAISKLYSQKAETIENGVSKYIIRLKEWERRIESYKSRSIDDLFL